MYKFTTNKINLGKLSILAVYLMESIGISDSPRRILKCYAKDTTKVKEIK